MNLFSFTTIFLSCITDKMNTPMRNRNCLHFGDNVIHPELYGGVRAAHHFQLSVLCFFDLFVFVLCLQSINVACILRLSIFCITTSIFSNIFCITTSNFSNIYCIVSLWLKLWTSCLMLFVV